MSLLAEFTPVYFMSPWKPFLVVAAFIAWAWLVGTKLDKDATKFHFDPVKWNSYQLGGAVVALATMLFIPNFYVSFPIGFALLFATTLVYWKFRNAEVPESEQFQLGTDGLRKRAELRKAMKAGRAVALKFEGHNGEVPVPDKTDDKLLAYLDAETLLSPALENRATRLEIKLNSKGCQGIYIVDGIPSKTDVLSAKDGVAAVGFLKEIAGADPADVRKKQHGTFTVMHEGGTTPIDLTASGTTGSHSLKIEFDRLKRIRIPIDSTGLLPKQIEALNVYQQDEHRHGVILVGSAKQQGLTATCYSLVHSHDSYLNNIIALEVENVAALEGVTHQLVGEDGGDYSTNLQTILRRDPEIILSADLNDAASASLAAKSGINGPLIFVGMNASSFRDLVSKWASLVGDPREAFNSLQAITYQRLVRKVCENCRVAYTPSEDLAKQGLPIKEVEQLYRAGGQLQVKNKVVECPVCKGNGYLGQIGVFETMFLTKDIRKQLIAGDLKAAMALAHREQKLVRLQDAGWAKVADGTTTLEEFGRVAKSGQSKKKTKKK
ncbi:MAG TPA: ATPase, T2SS/T4P/T4SS family [Phycisphaerales bacterium]|nr:ATPase, T2SS/T4P/T4SS family [Phycisphaerales bacterium]